jgi:hypothetical protein
MVGSLAASRADDVVELPERVGVHDVAIRHDCARRAFLRARDDDRVDAVRGEEVRHSAQAIVRPAGDDAGVHEAADGVHVYDGVASGWKPGMWRCGLRGAGGRRFGGFGMSFLR